MMKEAEFIGKKVQDAVNEGLKTLGITLDDAEIKILSNGGLFKKAKVVIKYDDGLKEGEAPQKPAPVKEEKEPGQGKTPAAAQEQKKQERRPERRKTDVPPEGEPHWGSAPVKREPTTAPNFGKSAAEKPEKATTQKESAPNKERGEGKKKENEKKKQPRESAIPTEEQIAAAKTFLTELLQKMNIEGGVEISVQDGMRVNVETEDARVIGHRGEVLDAMQQLIGAIINTSHGKYVHVTVDGLGYRDRRKDTLEGMARRMADKAVRTHRKVLLDPMNSADRRIVHAALGEREDVFTRSEGHDPARRVAIIPKRQH